MLACALSRLVLSPPPSLSEYQAHESSLCNGTFDPILKETLSLVDPTDIANFRAYLQSVPFVFDDLKSCIAGTTLESEADVAFFYNTNLVQACWPIALAMAPEERYFDLRLHSQRILDELTRPDMSFSVTRKSGTVYDSEIFLCLEFKAPGVCRFITSADLSESDDWERVSRQMRKYAVVNRVRYILIQDDTYLLYLRFEDPQNIAAEVTYTFAAAGTAGSHCLVSQRELFLYAFAEGLKYKIETLRDFGSVVVTSASRSLDYRDVFSPKTPPRFSAGASHATTRSQSSHNLVPGTTLQLSTAHPYRLEMVNCKFSAEDRTPSKLHDSGFLSSLGIRRPEKPELISTGNLRFQFKIEEVKKCIALAAFNEGSTDASARPHTPTASSGTVIKYFEQRDKLVDEVKGYASLKSEQGYTIPICYGMFDCEQYAGKFLLAERIKGYSIDQINETVARIKDVFEAAVRSLVRIHAAGFAHGDISSSNIIYSTELHTAVFVDLESVLPLTERLAKYDKACLRIAFRVLGLDEEWMKEEMK